MSAQCEVTARQAAGQPMSLFERYLTLWVALCILLGIGLGHLFPGVFESIGGMEVAHVNLPVAVLIWLMIIPMLLKIDFGALHEVRRHWRGIGVTLFINWGVKPFSMALFAAVFIYGLFAAWLPADQLDSYVAGLILLAAAPCTAMVFVWSRLTGGEPGHGGDQRTLGHPAALSAALHRRARAGGAGSAWQAAEKRRRSEA